MVSSTEGSRDEGRAKLKLRLGCINDEKYKACKKQSVLPSGKEQNEQTHKQRLENPGR